MMSGGVAGLESEPTVKTNKQTNKESKKQNKNKLTKEN